MLQKSFFLALAALVISLALSSPAHAWGAFHVGYTHYSPYTGLHHYGYTGFRTGYGGYGGYHYAGYRYGGYRYGGYGYGYYRRW